MTEEKDVNTEEATSSESTEQNEQTEEQSGASSQTVDGKDYKAIAEQLSKDIKEKNRKIQELKNQKVPDQEPQSEVEKRFLETEKRSIKTEAEMTIISKLQTDPTFKERVDIVKDYVSQGYNIEMADRLAKADIMDKILTALPNEELKPNKPKQIETQAIPENNEFQETGDHLKDILDDPNAPEYAKEAARRFFQ